MIAKLRHFVSRLINEEMKFDLSMRLSHITYFLMKLLKGTAPLWDEDKTFVQLYQKIKYRCLLDKGRAYVLYGLAQRQEKIDGDYVELGAYKCGGSYLISLGGTLKNKTLHIIDSFEGLPNTHEIDHYWKKGDMGKVNYDEIVGFLSNNLATVHYRIHRGFFPEKVDLDALNKVWSFVVIDTDLYKPTLEGLNYFYPRLASGGVILVDDYGNLSCPGVTKAVTEFCEAKQVHALFLATGQGLIFK